MLAAVTRKVREGRFGPVDVAAVGVRLGYVCVTRARPTAHAFVILIEGAYRHGTARAAVKPEDAGLPVISDPRCRSRRHRARQRRELHALLPCWRL